MTLTLNYCLVGFLGGLFYFFTYFIYLYLVIDILIYNMNILLYVDGCVCICVFLVPPAIRFSLLSVVFFLVKEKGLFSN